MGERGQTFGPSFEFGNGKNSGAITALRADFVMKPEASRLLQTGIESVMQGMNQEEGFLYGVVLISEQEARLGTMITFWNARRFEETRQRKLRWLDRVLKPYLDGSAKVRTNRTVVLLGEDEQDSRDIPAYARNAPSFEETVEAAYAI